MTWVAMQLVEACGGGGAQSSTSCPDVEDNIRPAGIDILLPFSHNEDGSTFEVGYIYFFSFSTGDRNGDFPVLQRSSSTRDMLECLGDGGTDSNAE